MARKSQVDQSAYSSDVRLGIRHSLPIVMGYLPYGIAYGLLSKQTGLNLLETLLMSAFVYAGTAQFVAVAMLQAGQAVSAIVISTFVINVRYVLMNGALLPMLKGWDGLHQFLLSFYVSDETFVVLSNHAQHKPLSKAYAFSVNGTALGGWLLCSYLGFGVGGYIPDLKKFGLDFTLSAVLIALSVLMIKSRLSAVVAILSCLFSTALVLAGYPQVSVLSAAIIAASFGTFFTWYRYDFR